MDESSVFKLEEICPTVSALAYRLDEALLAQGIMIRVTRALADHNAQHLLFAKGRLWTPAGWKVIDPSKVVTNADAGDSWHEYGLAFDVVPLEAGNPDWNSSHPVWGKIVAAIDSLGMVSGAHWKHPVDMPHAQLTGRFPVSPNAEVKEIYRNVGMRGVWAESGIWTPPLSAT